MSEWNRKSFAGAKSTVVRTLAGNLRDFCKGGKRCHSCRHHRASNLIGMRETFAIFVNEIFQMEGIPILVERIPSLVCNRCG
ncbi:MAG: hypothetical protein C4527_03315 [Candidatus Omnitrophota bacterium]|nr:MAG: hypothetical protein C4527_03315 [Candidatus Omnitrophota bacterium]